MNPNNNITWGEWQEIRGPDFWGYFREGVDQKGTKTRGAVQPRNSRVDVSLLRF